MQTVPAPTVDSSRERYTHLALELARASLAQDGMLRLTVTGLSMWPALHPGDALLVRPVEPKDLQRGDLLTVQTSSGLLTHRLVRKSLLSIQTKGDACRQMDTPAPYEAILGRVTSVERQHRRHYDYSLRRWRVLHLLTGLVGWGEGLLLAELERLASRIFPVGFPGRSRFGRIGRFFARLLSLPFRAATFLLQCVLGRIFVNDHA